LKKVFYILAFVVLTGVTVLCCIRWNAWFYNPPEPKWPNDTLDFRFITFGADSLKGFTKNENNVWKLFCEFGDAVLQSGCLIFSNELFTALSQSIPEEYWRKRAEQRLVR
jgi:hypothetical protein